MRGKRARAGLGGAATAQAECDVTCAAMRGPVALKMLVARGARCRSPCLAQGIKVNKPEIEHETKVSEHAQRRARKGDAQRQCAAMGGVSADRTGPESRSPYIQIGDLQRLVEGS